MYQSQVLVLQMILVVNSSAIVIRACDDQRPNAAEERKTGVWLNVSTNPFSDKAELLAKVRFIDRSSPSLAWFTERSVALKDGEYMSYVSSESLIRTMGLRKEEAEAINRAFKTRQEKHEENLQPLSTELQRDRESKLITKGFPSHLLKKASLAKLEESEIETYLRSYEEQELKVEAELISVLEEVLPPSKFEQLADFWLTPSNLYIPFAQYYLNLTDDQVQQIRQATFEKIRFEYELKESVSSESIDDVNAALISNPTWHENNYKPLSYLTLEQFMKVRRMLKSWKGIASFEAKLKALRETKSSAAQAELQVLGKLYEEGAKRERSQR